ncbi:hypothetical protein ANTRET_LOCUS8908 [Anthophora retusa]
MAVNRVVLQHFSVNLEELLENREPRLSTSSTDEDNHPYGHMSDSISELSEHSKLCATHSSNEFDANSRQDSSQQFFGLSPPIESSLMQRRLSARSDLLERQTNETVIASPSG